MTSRLPRSATLAAWPGPIALIAVAQLLGTSMWFSANGAGPSLMREWRVTSAEIGWLTSAVQAGFILGTLTIALTGVADRFRASRIFVVSSLSGAIFNGCFALLSTGMGDASVYRFLVGLSLAGVYPIGMKLLMTWVPERAGWALSLLVGMLTLGTALPHAFQWAGADLDWRLIASASSLLSLGGACIIYVLGDGPHSKQMPGKKVGLGQGLTSIAGAFRRPEFRAAAFGYFGHMWELYAFWTVLPLLLKHTIASGDGQESLHSALTFLIIAVGTLGCIAGGLWSLRIGSARVAAIALVTSGLSGSAFLLGWRFLPAEVLLLILLIWGVSVVADSPHFSALSAKACDLQHVGVALAIQNSLGFALTVVTITVVTSLLEHAGPDGAWFLVVGPLVGLWLFRPLLDPSR